jgi:nitrogen regulatory protein PII
MKMIIIAYNEAIDEDVMEMLRVNGQKEYTKWTKVRGWGRLSEPHLLTPVWPKANNILMTCVEDEKAGPIMDGVRKLRQTLGHAGVKAFCLPVDDVT